MVVGRALGRVASVALLLMGTSAASMGQETERAPQDVGLKERSASQLVQLDVSVYGDANAVEGLTVDDFVVVVNNRPVTDFVVDRVCREVRSDADVARLQADDASVLPPGAPPITYVFYFDQSHLTMEGYHRSFDLAEELIEGLFDVNAQAMIVSSARDMRVVTDLTSDKSALLAGLDAVKKDRTHFDSFGMEEEQRLREVATGRSPNARLALARIQQEIEIWAASRSLHRVSIALGRIAEVDPPKAFFYFADTMRRNTGQHYEILVGGSNLETYAFMALDSFDRIMDEASALGVRFYTVEARGLSGISLFAGGSTASQRRRTQDAQNTLAAMALETGGRAFLNGIPGNKIIQQMRTDLYCMYVISFSPQDFPLDKPMPVRVQTRRPGTQAKARGRLVIHSESANRHTRLMSAFSTGLDDGPQPTIAGRIVPTGFTDGRFTTLVQVTVPGTTIPNTTWDIGVSVVTKDKIRDDASGRLQGVAPGTALVFEHVMEFRPGPFELIAVAHETTTDQIFSARLDGEWPDLNEDDVTLIPPSMMQPETAIFLRDDTLKRSSALSFGTSPVLHGDRPIAILGLVCRAKRNKKPLTVERALIGNSTVHFDPLELDAASGRCALYRDLVPGGTLGAGGFQHQVRVAADGNEKAVQSSEFHIVAGPIEPVLQR